MTSVFGYCKADPNIPIDELDYGYIEKCKDINKLQKILEILRSGEEGRFPALEQFTEKQLAIKKPDSPLLEKVNIEKSIRELPKDEADPTIEDLKSFTSEFSGETDLSSRVDEKDGNLPPIRNSIKESTPKENVLENKKKQSVLPKGPEYWDKVTKEVDADSEGIYESVCQETKSKSTINVQTSKSAHELLSDKPTLKQNEKCSEKAEAEKNKGNEAFRCGDYDEALVYYNRSIDILSSAAAFNNRAITFIKLNKYNEALADCEKVIALEPYNIKAYMRRGIANQSLGFIEKACIDFKKVIELEPTNKRGAELLEEVKKEIEKKSPPLKKKGTRMKIEEINTNDVNVKEVIKENKDEPAEDFIKSSKIKNEMKNCAGIMSSDKSCSLADAMNCINKNKNVNTETIDKVKSHESNESLSSKNSETYSKSTVISNELPSNVVDAKNKGNSFFKSGRYDEACKMYSICIDTLSSEKEGYKSALATFYSNRSSCYTKMGDCRKCINDCDNSLELISSGKVFFKRASAYESIEKYIDAYRDYEYALKMDHSSASVLQALSRIGNSLRSLYGNNWREKLYKTEVRKNVQTDVPKEITGIATKTEKNGIRINEDCAEKLIPSVEQAKREENEKMTTEQDHSVVNISESVTKSEEKETYLSKSNENTVAGTPELKSKCNSSEEKPKKQGDKTTVDSEGSTHDKVGAKKTEKTTCKVTEERLAKEKRILDFFDMKEKGNKLVQKANYEEAAKCYTKCAELLPKEIASYTNRALCYLKLKQPNKAVEDCTSALKIQQSCVKALFRRAQGRKMLKEYKEALADFAKVLKIEPNNNAAKCEADACKSEFCAELRNIQAQNEAAKKKDLTGKGKKVVIEEVNSAELPTKNKMSTKVGKCPLAKGGSPRNPPKKMTGFEFLHAWNNVKSEKTSDYADLLMQIDPTKLPDLLSNKLDGEVLKNFIRTINDHFTNKDTFKQGIQLLKSLCKVSRFVTMLMFLNTTEKTLLRSAIDQLEIRVKQNNEKSLLPEVNSLRSSYRCS